MVDPNPNGGGGDDEEGAVGGAGGPQGDDAAARNVNAIFAKVPFPQLNSTANVETWFRKIEAWFDLQGLGIRKEVEKYNAVITYLDQKYLDQVHDLVINQPEQRPYSTLKEAILAKFAESQMARLDKLATGIQLGDGRPSHLLSQLQRTNATNDESVVRRYWIKRLPPAARAVIVGMLESNPNISLSQLAVTADSVMDSLNYAGESAVASISGSTNSINAISSTDNRFDKLEKRADKTEQTLQQINSKLGQLLNNNRSRTRERSQSQSQNNNRNTRPNTPQRTTTENQSSYCWYHSEYGSRARKCEEPCNYKQQHPPSNNSKN